MKHEDLNKFRFKGGDFWSYTETVEKIRSAGIEAIEKPSPAMLAKVQKALDTILQITDACRQLKMWRLDQDVPLKGIFVYDAARQAGDLKETLAMSTWASDESLGVIGFSLQLLEIPSPEYIAFCALHEAAHLISVEGHGDDFQKVMNELALAYFAKLDSNRMDSASVRHIKMLRGWRL